MIYIGIDPGVSGALAAIDADTGGVALFDVPTRKANKGTEYNAGGMADLIHEIAGVLPMWGTFATIETVSTPRGEGGKQSGNVTAALKIGRGAGLWEGVLAGARIPYEMTAAATWKREFSLIGCDKKASRARAQELFPHIREELGKRRPDFSEALLLAYYGKLRHSGIRK